MLAANTVKSAYLRFLFTQLNIQKTFRRRPGQEILCKTGVLKNFEKFT